MALECHVYKSAKQEHLYLFVMAEDGLSRVPDQLMAKFGEPKKTLSLTLKEDLFLAKEDPVEVMKNLQEHGYHLQLPPADERFV